MLVIGATGGVGMFVVQLAAAAGVEVLATAGPDDFEYARALGAAEVVDFTAGEVAEDVLRAHPGGVDVVIDLIDSGEEVRRAARAVRPGGLLVSSLGGPEDLEGGVRAIYTSMSVEEGDLEDLAGRAAAGTLRVEVSRVYPFAEAPQAFADFASQETRGKLVISVAG